MILALVFPAMIAAAVALAYYGFKHAEDVSRPVEQLFRLECQDYAESLAKSVETQLDREALALFAKIDELREDPASSDACELDPGPDVEAFVVLGEAGRIECMWPEPSQAEPKRRKPGAPAKPKIAWLHKIRNLAWDQVDPDSFAYHHEALDGGGSALLAYTVRRAANDVRYRVVAQLSLDFIGKQWVENELGPPRKNRRVAILDEASNLIAGARLAVPEARPGVRLFYEGPFGKALYRWRIQMVPQNVEEFQAQRERTKGFRRVLIMLATGIIAVGLVLVWLAILTERRASRMKSDFIANVSHELKTPLSLIRMFGEMVATGRHKGEKAAREYGGIITRESDRLSHLIDNVLDFSRIERGKSSYHFAEGDLAEVVERALDVCRYRLEREKVKLVVAIEPSLPPVRMDANEMTLVVLNLVDNAIKHAGDGGEVDVTVARAPGFVVLAVRDFGPGIAPEDHGRIFERFYRSQQTREKNVRGSGIGLALVKHIALAHGGRVTVQSPVPDSPDNPRGSVFKVFVPAPVPAGDEAPAVTSPGRGPT
ncbi:MAG: HAMP domain-containing histidine kinase [Deltaproteobacteria bacterium]|nr:HAMP domain-containing histidine kinase [Deltaproteobacteria bacterium]